MGPGINSIVRLIVGFCFYQDKKFLFCVFALKEGFFGLVKLHAKGTIELCAWCSRAAVKLPLLVVK